MIRQVESRDVNKSAWSLVISRGNMTVHRKNALRKKDKNSWNIFFEGYILLRNINSIESYDANESRGQTLGEYR